MMNYGVILHSFLQQWPEIFAIALAMDRDRYLNMVKMRYMSLLCRFTDGELWQGIEEIKTKYTDDILRFKDRFVFITVLK